MDKFRADRAFRIIEKKMQILYGFLLHMGYPEVYVKRASHFLEELFVLERDYNYFLEAVEEGKKFLKKRRVRMCQW